MHQKVCTWRKRLSRSYLTACSPRQVRSIQHVGMVPPAETAHSAEIVVISDGEDDDVLFVSPSHKRSVISSSHKVSVASLMLGAPSAEESRPLSIFVDSASEGSEEGRLPDPTDLLRSDPSESAKSSSFAPRGSRSAAAIDFDEVRNTRCSQTSRLSEHTDIFG